MTNLELFYPYRPFRVTQPFGANEACVKDFNKPTQHIRGKVNGVCPVGYRELYPLLGMKGHTGLDLYAPDGVVLHAPHDGYVREVQTEVERGLGVGIITPDKRRIGSYGEHYAKTRQWHLKAIFVKEGQYVRVGQPIGLADSTGLSSGSHNHFELKPVEYYPGGLRYYNVFQNNGHFGAIDPLPHFPGMYAQDYASYRTQLLNIAQQTLSVAQRLLTSMRK